MLLCSSLIVTLQELYRQCDVFHALDVNTHVNTVAHRGKMRVWSTVLLLQKLLSRSSLDKAAAVSKFLADKSWELIVEEKRISLR